MLNRSIRHSSRDAALKVVFSFFESNKKDVNNVFNYVMSEFFKWVKDISFSREIVDKVVFNNEKNEEWIKEFATSFTIEKTNPIDICILKILITEIFYLDNPTPIPVAVNEALLLASEYWKEWSTSFINWVIAKIINKYAKTTENS